MSSFNLQISNLCSSYCFSNLSSNCLVRDSTLSVYSFSSMEVSTGGGCYDCAGYCVIPNIWLLNLKFSSSRSMMRLSFS